MNRALGALLLLGALLPGAARAEPPAAPTPTRRPWTPRRPPLDFSGVWEIDTAASQGAPASMNGAVLSVVQSGNRITLQPVHGEHILLTADQIVADGRTYEKGVGTKMKGLVTVAWSPRGDSLRIEVTAGPTEDPKRMTQRSVWTLSRDKKVWVRQSVTTREGKSSLTRLVFRRRLGIPATPKVSPAP
ncbi:MAG: hypothetical protein ABR576_07325 [Thermoanaerobaculia bacterium]